MMQHFVAPNAGSVGAGAAEVVADELDRAAAREVAAVDPGEDAGHDAVVDELPDQLAARAPGADDQALALEGLEDGGDAGAVVDQGTRSRRSTRAAESWSERGSTRPARSCSGP
jgi:hypothetical protein